MFEEILPDAWAKAEADRERIALAWQRLDEEARREPLAALVFLGRIARTGWMAERSESRLAA